ncbi:MAG: IPT/TIG domain-containing protein, partial [Planctomycetota bacterium]|jgi:hypothetical protein
VDSQSDTQAGLFNYVPPPTVSSINPNFGPQAGGTAVAITGTDFQSGATVTIGGVAAMSVNVVNATTITCNTQWHAAGVVDVRVDNPDGLWSVLTGGFTYVPPPTITNVAPTSGPTAGGTAVIVTGTDFQANPMVTFGGFLATNVIFVNSTTITCSTPAMPAGATTLRVTNTDSQFHEIGSAFTFIPPPAITSVAPASGLVTGGTRLTISGSDFSTGATATVAGNACSNYDYTGVPNQVVCDVPSGSAGAADVAVTNPDTQSDTLTGGFTYAPLPTITTVSPNSATTGGGLPVTITGNYFQAGCYVTFAGRPASRVVFISPTQVDCSLPWGTVGAADVAMTNPDTGSVTLTGGFTYNQNYHLQFDGVNDFLDCGTSTNMDGFTACTLEAWFKINAYTNYGSVLRRNSSSNTCWTLQTFYQQVQFAIETPTNTFMYSNQNLSLNTWYHVACVYDGSQMRTYINGVLDNSRTASGTVRTNSSAHTYVGTENTIPSTFFNGWIDEGRVSNVAKYNANFSPPSVLVADSSTVLLLHMDEGSGANTADTSGLSNNGIFNGNPAWTAGEKIVIPTVSTVNPTTGPSAGGTSVTITGTNFLAGAVVQIGGSYARNVVIVNATTITCVTPAGSTGAANVEVFNPANQNGILAGGFTFQ